MPKDRGIDKVDEYFGDFTKIIAERVGNLRNKEKVKILDAGCGYGVAMIGFVKRFGNKVDMTGYNYSKKCGDLAMMKQQAIEKGIFSQEEIRDIGNSKFPKIVYCDASKHLPFKDNSFDFIYSMASIYLYDDKINFLKECNRVLRKNGIARISPSFGIHNDQSYGKVKNIPEEFWEFWSIWDKGKRVKPEVYMRRIKGVSVVWKNKGKRGGDKPLYIQIEKQKDLDFKLRFVSATDMNIIWTRWGGVKSIYTTQLKGNFEPRYKTEG